MEKTPLEERLEQTLAELDMPLGERIYAEDLDFEAEIEDMVSDVKSTDPLKEKIPELRFLEYIQLLEELSSAQRWVGQQPFLLRKSELYKGLGFSYVIEALKHKAGAKKYAQKIADEVIRNRDFGKFGDEGIKIFYNSDVSWRLGILKPRYHSQIVNRFYENHENCRFIFDVCSDNKISIYNPSKKENYEDCLVIAGILEEIESSFDGKLLTSENLERLMNYTKELKQLV